MMDPKIARALRAARGHYADGGQTRSWYDTISEYTQPIRDFSDRTGNTEFWRGIIANPGLGLAAQFVGRAPVRGTAAYDQAMMRVLDRRAGGPHSDNPALRRVGPEAAERFPTTAYPPVREGSYNTSAGLASQEGVRSAANPDWAPTMRGKYGTSGPALHIEERPSIARYGFSDRGMHRAGAGKYATDQDLAPLTPQQIRYLDELAAQQARRQFRMVDE